MVVPICLTDLFAPPLLLIIADDIAPLAGPALLMNFEGLKELMSLTLIIAPSAVVCNTTSSSSSPSYTSFTASTVWYFAGFCDSFERERPMQQENQEPMIKASNAKMTAHCKKPSSVKTKQASSPMNLHHVPLATWALRAAQDSAPKMLSSLLHSPRSCPSQPLMQMRSTMRLARGGFRRGSALTTDAAFVKVFSTVRSAAGTYIDLSSMYQSKFWKQPASKGANCIRLAVIADLPLKSAWRPNCTSTCGSSGSGGAVVGCATAGLVASSVSL
mmetsp:Transcript_132826/g.283825  ORF Transcript_132826/g.283825 Transcript_132826/m.283825 type:complete len:273 (+) Transcript_132826:252-1070(+)